jgi:hypothetical protein
MLGVSGKPVVTTAGEHFYPFLPARLRGYWAPGIPHALFGAANKSKARAHRAAGMRSYVSRHSGMVKDRTSDAQLRIGESRDSGFDAEPVIGPRYARTRWHRPGMTVSAV